MAHLTHASSEPAKFGGISAFRWHYTANTINWNNPLIMVRPNSLLRQDVCVFRRDGGVQMQICRQIYKHPNSKQVLETPSKVQLNSYAFQELQSRGCFSRWNPYPSGQWLCFILRSGADWYSEDDICSRDLTWAAGYELDVKRRSGHFEFPPVVV